MLLDNLTVQPADTALPIDHTPLAEPDENGVQNVGFLLLDGFCLLSLSSAVEVLLQARHQSGLPFSWRFLSSHGGAVRSAVGIDIPTQALAELPVNFATVFVCAEDTAPRLDTELRTTLLRLSRNGVALGGFGTGADVLAANGLLNGYRATRHWADAIVAEELFPTVNWSGGLFEIDEDRYTCAGGVATMDLMLQLVSRQHGQALAVGISDQIHLDQIRSQKEEQRGYTRLKHAGASKHFVRAVQLMETHIEEPLSLTALAHRIGVSRRHLERVFDNTERLSPGEYYRNMRLQKARSLITKTNLPIVDVSVATGFVSHSHFTKRYREQFNCSPRQDRLRQEFLPVPV